MVRFEINFLDDYTDESLLVEIRRVASLHVGGSLSAKTFVELSGRVSISTVRRRFGTWRVALSKAGFAHLYGGRTVSQKMKVQPAKGLTDDDIIFELKRVHALLGTETMNRAQFNEHSVTSYSAVHSRFGWPEALKLAGIPPAPTAKRKWTLEQCFENLVAVWTHYGRPPAYREMFEPPSTVSGKAYEGRWGTWRKALRAFVEWANSKTSKIHLKRLNLNSGRQMPRKLSWGSAPRKTIVKSDLDCGFESFSGTVSSVLPVVAAPQLTRTSFFTPITSRLSLWVAKPSSKTCRRFASRAISAKGRFDCKLRRGAWWVLAAACVK